MVAAGDDWRFICTFTGSQTELFTKFPELIKKNIDSMVLIKLLVNTTSDVTVKLLYEEHAGFDEVRNTFINIFKIIREGICVIR